MNWTEQDLAWLKINYPKFGAAYCAAHFNSTSDRVIGTCYRYKIKGSTKSLATKDRLKKLHSTTRGSRLKENYFELIMDPNGSYIHVELTQGQWAKCEVKDWFDTLIHYQWHAELDKKLGTYYARSSKTIIVKGKRKQVRFHMHRMTMGLEDIGTRIDHINHDTLCNIRSNLRPCTPTQNSYNCKIQKDNTSGFKGVFWYKKTSKWRSGIGINYKVKHIGYFTDKVEAAQAYDLHALKYQGEFACLNFPHLRDDYQLKLETNSLIEGHLPLIK